jgi:hypothetical protein
MQLHFSINSISISCEWLYFVKESDLKKSFFVANQTSFDALRVEENGNFPKQGLEQICIWHLVTPASQRPSVQP